MKLPLPLLEKDDPVHYPKDAEGKCPFCGGLFELTEGIAYMNTGVMWGSEKEGFSCDGPGKPSAFWHFGFLAKETDDIEASAEIVSDLGGNQFELSFCSLDCLRAWFNDVIDDMERQLWTYKWTWPDPE